MIPLLPTWKCPTWKMESADGKTTTFLVVSPVLAFGADEQPDWWVIDNKIGRPLITGKNEFDQGKSWTWTPPNATVKSHSHGLKKLNRIHRMVEGNACSSPGRAKPGRLPGECSRSRCPADYAKAAAQRGQSSGYSATEPMSGR